MPTIVHFNLPADNPERAKSFYRELFGWKFQAPPGFPDFYLVETEDQDGMPGIGGGMGKRESPDQRIMNYIGVSSVDEYLAKVQSLGGKIILPKMPVPGFGHLAVCMDTEENPFGLWEENPEAQ